MAGRSADLKWRGVVQASGPDAGRLLDGLVTNDLSDLDRSPAIHAGLLSPQGKILFAFFILRSGGCYLIDVAADRRRAREASSTSAAADGGPVHRPQRRDGGGGWLGWSTARPATRHPRRPRPAPSRPWLPYRPAGGTPASSSAVRR
jgi:hypothetical protein